MWKRVPTPKKYGNAVPTRSHPTTPLPLQQFLCGTNSRKPFLWKILTHCDSFGSGGELTGGSKFAAKSNNNSCCCMLKILQTVCSNRCYTCEGTEPCGVLRTSCNMVLTNFCLFVPTISVAKYFWKRELFMSLQNILQQWEKCKQKIFLAINGLKTTLDKF